MGGKSIIGSQLCNFEIVESESLPNFPFCNFKQWVTAAVQHRLCTRTPINSWVVKSCIKLRIYLYSLEVKVCESFPLRLFSTDYERTLINSWVVKSCIKLRIYLHFLEVKVCKSFSTDYERTPIDLGQQRLHKTFSFLCKIYSWHISGTVKPRAEKVSKNRICNIFKYVFPNVFSFILFLAWWQQKISLASITLNNVY